MPSMDTRKKIFPFLQNWKVRHIFCRVAVMGGGRSGWGCFVGFYFLCYFFTRLSSLPDRHKPKILCLSILDFTCCIKLSVENLIELLLEQRENAVDLVNVIKRVMPIIGVNVKKCWKLLATV